MEKKSARKAYAEHCSKLATEPEPFTYNPRDWPDDINEDQARELYDLGNFESDINAEDPAHRRSSRQGAGMTIGALVGLLGGSIAGSNMGNSIPSRIIGGIRGGLIGTAGGAAAGYGIGTLASPKTAAQQAYYKFAAQQEEDSGVSLPTQIGAGVGAAGLGGYSAYSVGRDIGTMRKQRYEGILAGRKAGLHGGNLRAAVDNNLVATLKQFGMSNPRDLNHMPVAKDMLRNPKRWVAGGGVGGALLGAGLGAGLGAIGNSVFG